MADDRDERHAEWLKSQGKVEFVCPHCGTSEYRTLVDTPKDFAAVLQAMREEFRRAHEEEPPCVPHDDDAERALVGAALIGLRRPELDKIHGHHFFRAFHGLVWDILREQPKATLEQVAYAVEARGRGRAELALETLKKLAGPYQVARFDDEVVNRVLGLAWQREMLFDAQAICAMLQRPGVPVNDVRDRMKMLRARLETGEVLPE